MNRQIVGPNFFDVIREKAAVRVGDNTVIPSSSNQPVFDAFSNAGSWIADRAGDVWGVAGNAAEFVGKGTAGLFGYPSAPVVGRDTAEQIERQSEGRAASTVLNWAGGAALAGAGVAGIAALIRRWREQTSEEDLEEARKRTGPIVSVSKRASGPQIIHSPEYQAQQQQQQQPDVEPETRVPSPSSPGDVSWRAPAVAIGIGGGGLLGYLLLRNMFDEDEKDRLRRKRINAEQSFTKAISGALRPQGLRVTAKRASIQSLSDEDALMAVLDGIAQEQVEKRASTVGELGYWGLLGLLGLGAAGAGLGWRYSAKKNPFRMELKNIKKRRLLTAINAPRPPILTMAPSKKKKRSDEDDEEDGEYGAQ